MPRDSNGNFTLAPGNPVQSGQVITTKWANETLADIANELTNSLDRSGRGGLQSPLFFLDGNNGAPSISFSNDPDTGLYRAGTNLLGVAAAGSPAARFSTTSGRQIEVWEENAWTPVMISGVAWAYEMQFDDSSTSIKAPNVQTMLEELDGMISSLSEFPPGTRMPFHQSSAPPGWSIVTGLDGSGLRVVSSGGGSSGGSDDWTGLSATDEHVLAESEIPAHTHQYARSAGSTFNLSSGGGNYFFLSGNNWDDSRPSGGGAGHSHSISWSPKYLNVILAAKN